MISDIIFDGIVLALDIHPTVGIVLTTHTRAVKVVAFNESTTGALFDVDLLRRHFRPNRIVEDLIPIAEVWFVVNPMTNLKDRHKN
jgi:hypothetical protein